METWGTIIWSHHISSFGAGLQVLRFSGKRLISQQKRIAFKV